MLIPKKFLSTGQEAGGSGKKTQLGIAIQADQTLSQNTNLAWRTRSQEKAFWSGLGDYGTGTV